MKLWALLNHAKALQIPQHWFTLKTKTNYYRHVWLGISETRISTVTLYITRIT